MKRIEQWWARQGRFSGILFFNEEKAIGGCHVMMEATHLDHHTTLPSNVDNPMIFTEFVDQTHRNVLLNMYIQLLFAKFKRYA